MWKQIAARLGRRVMRPAPHVAAVARHNDWLLPDAGTGAQTRVYQQSPWVYVAVNRIAEAAALVPLRVVGRAGEPDSTHPAQALINAPNPFSAASS
jgi:phage portal protein BeeE